MNFLSESLTAKIKEQVKDQLPQILPKEVCNFAPPMTEALIKESRNEVTLAKKRKLSKDAEPTTDPKKKDSTFGSSKGTKSQPKSFGNFVQSEELVFEVAESDILQDQEGNLGDNEDESRNDTTSRCGDYPFDLSKPLPLIKHGKRQRVPFEYFINNDLKYLQGGVLTMTYTTSTTKSKAAQYDLPGIEDMVPNIWSPVKVADRYALWGNEETWIRVLEEIIVRRVDNNRLINISGDDVADFAIALRMFTRSLVVQKRVEDLQLGVEGYQKKINVTKPDTTRLDFRKRHPYTPYRDPQGFIYVDDYKRNRSIRSDELYKFSDDTLTRLLSSLEDITKNINMEYLPKRRWITLEKKRAHFMIKDINKLLKERRMMRSLRNLLVVDSTELTSDCCKEQYDLVDPHGFEGIFKDGDGGELAHTKLIVELADRTLKYPKGIAENMLVGIGKFVFPVDFIILDISEDIKVPLILGRPFLSAAHAKIDVFKRNFTLSFGEERIIFKSVKPASSLIKRVYMLGLKERMELDLEARLIGETLVLNRSLDPFFKDYIELNDLNVPLEIRRDQVDDLMPTIEEGEVIEEFRARNDTRMDKLEYKGNNVVGALMNKPIFVGTFSILTDFAVLEDMDAYRDE
ncbi:retrovirus-related pol polyprotein from transposon TNT 1-94 [Tanacetum coccineum]